MSRGSELIKKATDYLRVTNTFQSCMRSLNFLSAEEGKFKAELTVDQSHVNPNGSLHGGLTATLVDVSSYWALASQKGPVKALTTDLHVSYLKAAFLGDVITIDAKVCHTGQHMCFLEVELSKKDNGDCIARGQTTMYLPPKKNNES